MTAIDRTAYPRPGRRLTREELSARYDLTETDLAFIRAVPAVMVAAWYSLLAPLCIRSYLLMSRSSPSSAQP